jgi:hypothetical protein
MSLSFLGDMGAVLGVLIAKASDGSKAPSTKMEWSEATQQMRIKISYGRQKNQQIHWKQVTSRTIEPSL